LPAWRRGRNEEAARDDEDESNEAVHGVSSIKG
jgi:hypothetical protein